MIRCPGCSHPVSRVIDSRPIEGTVRRRRKCQKCGTTWFTRECVERQISSPDIPLIPAE
ncbi:NrdR family transcriptional regulator [Methylobacterium sp. Gmos1]